MSKQSFVNRFRRLRWKLTLTYTGVTVGALLVVEIALLGISFGLLFILLYNGFLPRLIIEEMMEAVIPELRPYLSESPPDTDAIAVWLQEGESSPGSSTQLAGDTSIIIFGEEVPPDVLVIGSDGRILGLQPAGLSESYPIGEPVDTGVMTGLEAPLKAALDGEDDLNFLYAIHGNRLILTAPVSDETGDRVLGVLVYSVAMPELLVIVVNLLQTFGISLLCFTVTAGMVGTIFGFLTARGLLRRIDHLSEATHAWRRGDFSVFVDDPSGDELGQLARRLNRMAEQLQNLLDTRQELAIVEERNRLARDLHDSAKQQAFAAAAQIGAAWELLKQNPEEATAHIAEAGRLTDDLRRELTDLIRELRPAALEGKGLTPALRDFITDWSRQTGVTPEVRMQGERPLPLEIEQVLFRIAQEALANVARHSEANSVEIRLTYGTGSITLDIIDDGQGFDADAERTGLGLTSMRERAESLGGTLSIESTSGKGTCISCAVPVDIPGGDGEE